MLLCSVENKGILGEAFQWLQKRPFITQKFGLNPQIYRRFGLDGHNGIDYRAAVGTPLFAPMSGIARVGDQGGVGYGKFVKIRNPFRLLECTIGHFSDVQIKDGQKVNMGDFIGLSGNTGFSTGPHVHEGFRRLKESTSKDIYKWTVADYDNGFKGYFDQIEYMITYKGSLLRSSLFSRS